MKNAWTTGNILPLKVKQDDASKRRGPLAERHGVTSQRLYSSVSVVLDMLLFISNC